MFGFLSALPPWGLDLVYWRRPQETLFVFVSLFALLLSLSLFSVLTVTSYAALGLLTTTFSFVTYRKCKPGVVLVRPWGAMGLVYEVDWWWRAGW